MSLQDKRKAVPGPSSSSKRVRIDDTSRRAAHRHADTDYFDGDPEIEEQDRRRLRKDQKRGRIDDRGEDLSASDDSDDDVDSDASADAGSHRRRAERQRTARAKDDAADDDDDMFEVGSDDDTSASKGKGKAPGKKRFLKLGELEEGQEFGSKKRSALDADPDADLLRGGSANDSDDADPDLELEDDASNLANGSHEPVDLNAYAERSPPTSPGGTLRARAKAPKVTGFNMSDEMRTGVFDADGNYHEHARDPHAQHDAWLTGVYSRTKILDARRAQQARDRAARERDEAEAQHDGDEDDVKRRLVEYMHRHETVQRTLQRLGKHLSDQRKQQADAREAAKDVETVTHLASVLMSRFGRLDVYDQTYSALLSDVHRSGLVRNTFDPASKFDAPTESVEASQAEEWEYRWTPAYLAAAAREAGTPVDPDVQTFGPFSLADLHAWAGEGYFGDSGERILVRRVGSKDWIAYTQIDEDG